MITSRQNPTIKHMRALRRKKARTEHGQLLVEGLRHVGEALEHGAHLDAVAYTAGLRDIDYTQELLAALAAKGVEALEVSADVFASIAEKDATDGIIAVARQRTRTLDALQAADAPFVCAVARPQDPGNVGTLLRTADAAGASALIVIGTSVDVFHPTAVRASMGTLFRQPPVLCALDAFTAWAKREGYRVYGSSATGATDFHEVRYAFPAVLLLGSEREGLNAEERAACDELVRLPMHGAATSLNLSVAGGILLYAMEAQLNPRA